MIHIPSYCWKKGKNPDIFVILFVVLLGDRHGHKIMQSSLSTGGVCKYFGIYCDSIVL